MKIDLTQHWELCDALRKYAVDTRTPSGYQVTPEQAAIEILNFYLSTHDEVITVRRHTGNGYL